MRICTLGFWVGLEPIKAFEVWRWKACISVSCQEDMGFLGSETELYSVQVPLENRYWMKFASLHQESFSENGACAWLVNNYATNLSQKIGLSEGAYVWGTCHHGQTDATPAGDDLQRWPAGMTKWPLGWVWSPHLSRSCLLFCHALWGTRLLDFLYFLSATYINKHLQSLLIITV